MMLLPFDQMRHYDGSGYSLILQNFLARLSGTIIYLVRHPCLQYLHAFHRKPQSFRPTRDVQRPFIQAGLQCLCSQHFTAFTPLCRDSLVPPDVLRER